MIIKTRVVVGKTEYEFHIDERSDLDALHKAAVLGNPPGYCPLCKNQEFFKLDSNKDKEGNTYINLNCKKCGAKAKLGLYKTGGYFWHKFEKYVKPVEDNKNYGVPEKGEPAPEHDESSDIPF